MFGLFDTEAKKARKLRLEYEDIRQRYLLKMNTFEQSSVRGAWMALPRDVLSRFEHISDEDCSEWQKLGDELRREAKLAFNMYSRRGGLDGEGGRAGAEGLALLSIKASARSLRVAEAFTLRHDVDEFLREIDLYTGE